MFWMYQLVLRIRWMNSIASILADKGYFSELKPCRAQNWPVERADAGPVQYRLHTMILRLVLPQIQSNAAALEHRITFHLCMMPP